jgi:ABC-2 type transport system ATP-binding protein
VGEDRTVVLSTHQTEDVAALCNRIIVLHEGRIHFDGTAPELARQAQGHVWVDDVRDPRARLSWRTGDGLHRQIGDPPVGAELVAPTIEDAYLLLVGEGANESLAVTP